MPKYIPDDEEMGAYGSEPTPMTQAKAPKEERSVDQENSAKAEILISTDDLPGDCEVGDTYTFRVVKDYGDEKSLQLVKNEKPEDMENEEPMSTEAQELNALSEESE